MFLDVLQNSHQKFHMGFSSKGVKKSFRTPSDNEKDKESCISRLHFCVSLGDKDAVITELFIKKKDMEVKLSAWHTARMNNKPGTSQQVVVLS